MPDGIVPQNLLLYKEAGSNQDGNKELKDLFETQLFSFPKNTKLINIFLTIANTNKDSLILDFFSGSATTAHAVMQLNAQDGGNRKFIVCWKRAFRRETLECGCSAVKRCKLW